MCVQNYHLDHTQFYLTYYLKVFCMNLAHAQVFEIMNLQEEEEEEEDCAKLMSCFRILTCKIPLLVLVLVSFKSHPRGLLAQCLEDHTKSMENHELCEHENRM